MFRSIARKWAEPLLRWIIAITFIVASFHKIVDPAQFAKIIYGYGLVPHGAINLIALVLPFLELVTGLLLLTGRYRKASALLATAMMAVFIIAIAVNLVRGHEFDCGCFSFQTEDSLFGTNFLLIRDVILFIICLFLIRHSGEPPARVPAK